MARLASAVALLVVSGCGAFRGPAEPPSAPLAESLPGEVRVSLLWAAPVDLDLYVTDPTQEAVYFANNPSASGGELERDVRCDQISGEARYAETVEWARSVPGSYRVSVDFPDPCGGGPEAVSYRLVVDVGSRRTIIDERAKLLVFSPLVFDFEVPEDAP